MEININLFEERLEKLVIDYTKKKYKIHFYEFINEINVLLLKMKANFCLRSERDEDNDTFQIVLQYYNKDLKTISEIHIDTDIYNCFWRDDDGEEDDHWNTHIIAIEISSLIEYMNKHKIQIKNMLKSKKYKKETIIKNYKDYY